MKKDDIEQQILAGSKIFYGWWIVCGVFIVAAMAPIGRYILSALFPFIQEETGWSRQVLGIAFSIHFWVYAFMAILAGRMVDSLGGKITIFIGGVLLLIGLVSLSLANQVWHIYLVFGGILSAGLSMTFFVPNLTLIRKWFTKRAGLATAFVTVGISLGLALIIPTITHLSGQFGWRRVCLTSGIGIGAVIMFISFLILKNTPESMGLMPDGEKNEDMPRTKRNETKVLSPNTDHKEWTASSSIRSFNFLNLFIAYSVMGIAVQGLMAHIFMWGVDLGLSPSQSGIIMIALAIPSIPLRIIGGWLGDRFGKQKVLVWFNILTAAVWFSGWYCISDIPSFIIFAILMGSCYTAPMSLYTPFLGDLFGRISLGTLMGILTFGHGIIGSLGPITWGWIADQTGSYRGACILSAFCYLIIVTSLLLIRFPKVSVSAKLCQGDQ